MRHLKTGIYLIALCLFSGTMYTNLNAQKPVVAILAWDEKAKESSDPADIRIIQVGEPDPDLIVKIKTSGTADAGFDYICLKDTWKINRMVQLKVFPIDDGMEEGDETVTVVLQKVPTIQLKKIMKVLQSQFRMDPFLM